MPPDTAIDSLAVPNHVAIIMDGNGRWARSRGLPRPYGHRRGVEAVRRTVEAATDLGISYLTLFGFSTENWKRPIEEVAELLRLLRMYLRGHVAELCENGVRLQVIGDRSRFDQDIVDLIGHAEELTASNKRLTLTVALNYGARQELVAATRRLVREALAANRHDDALDDTLIDETAIARNLFTAELPDPDLIIRTSGEKRISNFLLWQAAYAELVFVDTLWPDFNRLELEQAIGEYGRRERRYGALVSGE